MGFGAKSTSTEQWSCATNVVVARLQKRPEIFAEISPGVKLDRSKSYGPSWSSLCAMATVVYLTKMLKPSSSHAPLPKTHTHDLHLLEGRSYIGSPQSFSN